MKVNEDTVIAKVILIFHRGATITHHPPGFSIFTSDKVYEGKRS